MHFDPKLVSHSCVAFSLIPLIYPQTLPDDPKTIIEVANEIASKKFGQSQAMQLFNLGRVHQKLESKCQEIQTNTSGVWGFFRYFLNSSALTEQKAILEEAKNMSLYIEEVVKAAPTTETDPSTKDVPTETDPPDMQENKAIESDGSLVTEMPEETPPAPVAPPPPPGETPQPQPPPPPPGETPGAPPPPPAPPPVNITLSSSQNSAGISPEEKHLAREKDRLNRGLKERANPDVFFSSYPPKNERELSEKKQEIVKDIERIKKYDDAAWLEEKESALAKITEQLKPQKIMLQYANPQQRAQFNAIVAKYTNEELRIIIGIMFNGNSPELGHPTHSYYTCNQSILDKIFKDWKQLSSGEKGKAFLVHEEEWKRNLQSNLFGFILTLRNRMLPVKHRDHLKEPIYQITPYGKSKEMKLPPGQELTSVYVDELKKAIDKRAKK